MGTALCFISKQGAGKNILSDFISNFIFGEKYSNSISDIDKVVGKFNSIIQNKLFTVLNECAQVNSSDYNTYWEQMKALITEKTFNMEKKYFDSVNMPNFNYFWLFSNNPNPIKIDGSNRRYTVMYCSDIYKGNDEYFDKLADALNQENANIFYSFLMDRDLSKFKFNSILLTEATKDQIKHCLSPINKFLFEKSISIYKNMNNDKLMITTTKLYDHYTKFCADNKCRDLGQIIFTKELKLILEYKEVKAKDRKSLRVFIFDIKKIKEYFLRDHKLDLEEIKNKEEIDIDIYDLLEE
jgi:hypothetical protein